MAANSCEIRAGRLLQIRVAKGYESPQDVDDMISMIRAATSQLPAEEKHVTVADWRRYHLAYAYGSKDCPAV